MKDTYYQFLSYAMFVAFVFMGFVCVLEGRTIDSSTKDVIYLRAENTCLKREIVKANLFEPVIIIKQ